MTPRKASAMQEIAMNPSRHSKSTSLSSRRLRFNSFLNMRMNLQIFFPYLFVYLDYVVHKVDTETHLFSLNEFSNRSGVMLFLSSYTNLWSFNYFLQSSSPSIEDKTPPLNLKFKIWQFHTEFKNGFLSTEKIRNWSSSCLLSCKTLYERAMPSSPTIQEGRSTNWNSGGSIWTYENALLLWGWLSNRTGCPVRLWSFYPWRYTKAIWT